MIEMSTMKIENYQITLMPQSKLGPEKVFVDLLHKNDMFIGTLWHEVGHIHYGHLAMIHSQEELRRIRNEGMIGGGVSKFELEAD
jgi:hypothetical protein